MARSEKDRETFLGMLEKYPYIQTAAKQAGISRATIDRWMRSNLEFRRKVERAQKIGRMNLVDRTEMSLDYLANKKLHFGAQKLILESNSKRYAPKARRPRPPQDEAEPWGPAYSRPALGEKWTPLQLEVAYAFTKSENDLLRKKYEKEIARDTEQPTPKPNP
ncbi:MAG: hypothetical protein KGI78_03610 [Patescibacteria group bacterium]|nr:hypothetical protein [Patescibacteria group bacterium]MDE2057913.1 hypothetical protein [Patescibacteria group bacterium]